MAAGAPLAAPVWQRPDGGSRHEYFRRQGPRGEAADQTDGLDDALAAAGKGPAMLPVYDELRPRRFPIVDVALIAADFAVSLLHGAPARRPSFQRLVLPLHRRQRLPGPEAMEVGWLTAMFMHGS